MNTNKLTQKSIAALGDARAEAISRSNSQVEAEHLLYALLAQEEGLIPRLFKKMGLDPEAATTTIQGYLDQLPYISGKTESDMYYSQVIERILIEAEKQAAQFKDEYISVEHLMLGFFNDKNQKIKDMLRDIRADKQSFMNALQSVRHLF